MTFTKTKLRTKRNKENKFKNASGTFLINLFFIEENQYAIGELQLTRKSNGKKRHEKYKRKLLT